MTRRFRPLDDDEMTALATRWLGSWPRPELTVYIEIEDNDEPDKG